MSSHTVSVTDYRHSNEGALDDVRRGAKDYRLAFLLGWQDIRQRYRRSTLGPFWITIGRAVLIATIGIVFGQLFSRPMAEYLPFLAVGLILWGFTTSVFNEACKAFIVSEALIKQLSLPLFTHVLRVLIRNVLILAHHLLILPLVFLGYGIRPGLEALMAIPGFVILGLNLLGLSLILGILCARYRDTPQIVDSFLSVFFYVTPIMWTPALFVGEIPFYLLTLNPFYHFLQIVRAPLLSTSPSPLNWAVCLCMTAMVWIIAIALFERTHKRIAFWL